MRTGLIVAALCVGAVSLTGSALAASTPPATKAAPAAATPRTALTLVDDTGATIVLKGPAQRIVSLTPGGTEMLFSAGAGARIVATVRGSDAPAAAKSVPTIGDANALDYERLVALKPDVVVVWEDLTNRLVVESLRQLKLPLYFIRAKSLGDIPRSVRKLGLLAGTQKIADPAAAALDAQLAAVARRAVKGEPLRVFYMIWAEPLYTVGNRHIISDAIARCGGRNIFDDIDFPAPIVEIEAIVKRNPEVMLLSAPPITARDWRERWAQFKTVRAVQTNQMLSFSDTRLDRMGPTAIEAVEGLCKMLDQSRAALQRDVPKPGARPAPKAS